MQINVENKVGARFKLIVRKAKTDEVSRESEWSHNLVLDTGLVRMGVGNWASTCQVGSGNSEPIPTQVALDNFIASTTQQQSVSGGVQVATNPVYAFMKKTWRFAQGVAAGNISEVGLGWAVGQLWNRALIRDSNGNPTTITVLSDEYLDVISEVRIYPANNFSGSVNLLDKTGAVLSSHTYVGKPILKNANWSDQQYTIQSTYIYTGAIGATVSNEPTGNLSGQLSNIHQTTINGLTLQSVATIELAVANGSHRSIVQYFGGPLTAGNLNIGYQYEITPPITKTADQRMQYFFDFTWGRYTP